MEIYLPKTPKISTEVQQILLVTSCSKLFENFLEILLKISEHFTTNLFRICPKFFKKLKKNYLKNHINISSNLVFDILQKVF